MRAVTDQLPVDAETDAPWVEIEDRFAPVPETLLLDPRLSPLAKVVYAILRRHGDDPTNCYPSHLRIASFVGCAERSIRRPIIDLEQAGWLQRRRRFRGREVSSGYLLHSIPRRDDRAVARGAHAETRAPVARQSASVGRAVARDERKPLEREPENERTTDTRAALERAPSNDADPFETFWRIYPRRVAKQAARRAWDKATGQAPAGQILVGARRYRDDPNRVDEFTAHPTTWLNQGRWDDEPLPARGAAARGPQRTRLGQLAAMHERERAREAGA